MAVQILLGIALAIVSCFIRVNRRLLDIGVFVGWALIGAIAVIGALYDAWIPLVGYTLGFLLPELWTAIKKWLSTMRGWVVLCGILIGLYVVITGQISAFIGTILMLGLCLFAVKKMFGGLFPSKRKMFH